MSTTITSDQISHTYGYAWLGTAGKSASTLTRDGVEVRRNLCTNPGFEVDTTGWSTSGTAALTYAWTGGANASSSTETRNGTVVRTNLFSTNPSFEYAGDALRGWSVGSSWTAAAAPVGHDGATAMQLTRNTAAPGSGYLATTAPVTAGQTYTFSFWAFGGSGMFDILCDGADFGGGNTIYPFAAPVQRWTRISATFTAKVTGSPNFFVRDDTNPSPIVGSALFLDSFMLEQASTVSDYFDGSTAAVSKGLDVLRSTSAAHAGAASMQVRWRGQPSSAAMYATTTFSGLALDTDYMASFWISIPTRLLKPITLSIVTTTGVVGPNPITLQEATAGWQRIVLPFRTATNRTAASLWIYDPNVYLAGVVTQSIYIDDMLAETGGAVLPYFDGATLSYVEFENTKPLVLNGWQEAATSLNIVHPVVGGGVDVTLRDASLRSGSFELVYENEDDAAAAFAMHRRRSTFTISDSDRASVSMTYVVNGQISRALDDETREYWLVRVEYQEV